MTAIRTAEPPKTIESGDLEWRRFYMAGAICAGLYVLGALLIPGVMVAAVSDF